MKQGGVEFSGFANVGQLLCECISSTTLEPGVSYGVFIVAYMPSTTHSFLLTHNTSSLPPRKFYVSCWQILESPLPLDY